MEAGRSDPVPATARWGKGEEAVRVVVYDRYGPPEVLRFEEVERPVPGDGEILIRVHASTVNRTDCGFRSADTFLIRFFTGLLRPKRYVVGNELAGEVVATGAAVTEFKVGDRVFGLKAGANAEYVCAPESAPLAVMPPRLSFEEAAAVCDGAIQALAPLRAAAIGSGTRILVYGASGSVGTAAVQLARYMGAHVTGVCNTKNVELVTSLGADEVIDYQKEDFTRNGETYDVILDAVGLHSFRRCRGSLKKGGTYFATDLGFLYQNPFLALWTRCSATGRCGFRSPATTSPTSSS
jgi:NADPH:quinone reductase-like Zn-dependent oxidoreductase